MIKEEEPENNNNNNKKMWIRRLFQERKNKGLYNVLVKDLSLFDIKYFFKSF